MWNFGGIVYRIWAAAGIVTFLGIVCLLFANIGKKDFNKNLLIAGILGVVVGIAFGIDYASSLLSPEVRSFQGVFFQSYRNSRVAPPLPFTWEYSFCSSDGSKILLYLDTFTRKEIIPENFTLNEEYIVYYEEDTKVIVGVEKVTPEA